MVGGMDLYRFISDKWNLKIFLNLDILSFDEFLELPIVKSLTNRAKYFSVQKIWDFFYHNPLCDAWWSNGLVYVDFLVRDNKVRKVYENLELFVAERICPYGVSPADVFDFLGVASLDEIKYYETSFRYLEFEVCKICGQNFFVSEIIDLGQNGPHVCVYCYNNMTLQDRISLEDDTLRNRRIEETWRVLSVDKRKKLLFSVFRRVLGKDFPYRLLNVKDFVSKVSSIEDFNKVKAMLNHGELVLLENELDRLFIIWWKEVENRETPNEA